MKAYMMIKPCNERLIPEITEQIVLQRLNIVAFYGVTLTAEEVIELYADKIGEEWFSELVNHTASGICYVIEVCGDDAIDKLLSLKVQVREKHAKSLLYDVVHSPDTLQNAEHELSIFSRAERVEIPLAYPLFYIAILNEI